MNVKADAHKIKLCMLSFEEYTNGHGQTKFLYLPLPPFHFLKQRHSELNNLASPPLLISIPPIRIERVLNKNILKRTGRKV